MQGQAEGLHHPVLTVPEASGMLPVHGYSSIVGGKRLMHSLETGLHIDENRRVKNPVRLVRTCHSSMITQVNCKNQKWMEIEARSS